MKIAKAYIMQYFCLFFLYICVYCFHSFFCVSVRAIAMESKEPESKQVLLLEKGESTDILSPSFEKIWLSKPGIVSVQDKRASLSIQARKEGEVLLNAGSRLYLIQVLSREKKNHLIAVNEFLSNRMGLNAEFVKNKIHIQGTLYRVKDFVDFSRLAQELNFDWVFSARVEAAIQNILEAHIQEKISSDFIPPPVLLWGRPVTALVPEDKSLTNLYQTRLKRFGIAVKQDPSLLLVLPLIELKILLVESHASHSFQAHIDYGGKIINRLLDGRIFSEMLSELQTMESKGRARIFSTATLLSESGKQSRFRSGGEVPVPHFNPESGAQGIKWKPYGVQLNFTAQADRRGKIHIDTRAEISEVDHSHSARSAPSIKNSHIHTSVTMSSGQSLLLSKLIRRQKGKSHSSPMEIFRLPLVGPFLSFKGKVKEHTRLNIFITANLLKQK